MRNMSFSLTTPQVRAGTKDVTRRRGWWFAKAGDVYCAIEKGQGLKKGEHIVRIRTIEVVSARRERLDRLTTDLDYGFSETTREGFPDGHPKHFPSEFVAMFCAHNGCEPSEEVNRIEFRYLTLNE